jgi:DNA topoisomerase VI subunit A
VAGLGLDPIKQMGQIAMDERAEVNVRVKVLKVLCQYIAPKRKAMAVTSEDDGLVKTELTVSEWLDSINGQRLGPPSER